MTDPKEVFGSSYVPGKSLRNYLHLHERDIPDLAASTHIGLLITEASKQARAMAAKSGLKIHNTHETLFLEPEDTARILNLIDRACLSNQPDTSKVN